LWLVARWIILRFLACWGAVYGGVISLVLLFAFVSSLSWFLLIEDAKEGNFAARGKDSHAGGKTSGYHQFHCSVMEGAAWWHVQVAQPFKAGKRRLIFNDRHVVTDGSRGMNSLAGKGKR